MFTRSIQEGKKPSEDDEDDLEDEDDEDDEQPKKPLKTTFELNDTLYAEAELEDTDTVYLWLGVRCASLNSSSGPDMHSGKRHAIVQDTCSDRAPTIKTRGCRDDPCERH